MYIVRQSDEGDEHQMPKRMELRDAVLNEMIEKVGSPEKYNDLVKQAYEAIDYLGFKVDRLNPYSYVTSKARVSSKLEEAELEAEICLFMEKYIPTKFMDELQAKRFFEDIDSYSSSKELNSECVWGSEVCKPCPAKDLCSLAHEVLNEEQHGVS
jgi:hypothetical protein